MQTKLTTHSSNLKFLWYLLIIIIYSCSENSETIESNNSELIIVSISTLSGISGDEVIITWSGLNEPVDTIEVYFNSTQSQIVTFSDNQLTCVVPENATSGLIQIIINGYEANSNETFTIDNGNLLNFEISELIPNQPRPGYKVQFLGNGFGSDISDVDILFETEENEFVIAKILQLNDNLIEVAVPKTAISGNINITVSGEELILDTTLSQINHEIIYFYQNGRLKYFEYNEDETISALNVSNTSSDIAEGYNLAYNSSENYFYGFTHYNIGNGNNLRYYRFNESNNQWNINTLCQSSGSSCSIDLGSVTNTSDNRTFTFERTDLSFSTLLGVSLKEVNNLGETINQYDFPDVDIFSISNILYTPDSNQFIFINHPATSGANLFKIDGSTFEISQTPIELASNFSESNLQLSLDVQQNRLFLARQDDIYLIDYVSNTIQSLNTDWLDYIQNITNVNSSLQPENFVYYEPTNDFLIQASIPNVGVQIFSINQATLETSNVNISGQVYGSNGRVFQWIMK